MIIKLYYGVSQVNCDVTLWAYKTAHWQSSGDKSPIYIYIYIYIYLNLPNKLTDNLVTNHDTIQTRVKPTGALGRQIPKRIKKMTDILFSDYYTTTTGICYLSTTIPEHRMCLNWFIDTQFRLFRCHSYSKNFKTSDRHAICIVCQNRFVSTHSLSDRMHRTTEYSPKYYTGTTPCSSFPSRNPSLINKSLNIFAPFIKFVMITWNQCTHVTGASIGYRLRLRLIQIIRKAMYIISAVIFYDKYLCLIRT